MQREKSHIPVSNPSPHNPPQYRFLTQISSPCSLASHCSRSPTPRFGRRSRAPKIGPQAMTRNAAARRGPRTASSNPSTYSITTPMVRFEGCCSHPQPRGAPSRLMTERIGSAVSHRPALHSLLSTRYSIYMIHTTSYDHRHLPSVSDAPSNGLASMAMLSRHWPPIGVVSFVVRPVLSTVFAPCSCRRVTQNVQSMSACGSVLGMCECLRRDGDAASGG